jgi:hypothetical protein
VRQEAQDLQAQPEIPVSKEKLVPRALKEMKDPLDLPDLRETLAKLDLRVQSVIQDLPELKGRRGPQVPLETPAPPVRRGRRGPPALRVQRERTAQTEQA